MSIRGSAGAETERQITERSTFVLRGDSSFVCSDLMCFSYDSRLMSSMGIRLDRSTRSQLGLACNSSSGWLQIRVHTRSKNSRYILVQDFIKRDKVFSEGFWFVDSILQTCEQKFCPLITFDYVLT